MDYEKFVEELVDGPIGDLIRERFVKSLISDLEWDGKQRPSNWTQEQIDENREWCAGVIEYLRENY